MELNRKFDSWKSSNKGRQDAGINAFCSEFRRAYLMFVGHQFDILDLLALFLKNVVSNGEAMAPWGPKGAMGPIGPMGSMEPNGHPVGLPWPSHGAQWGPMGPNTP